MTTTKFGLTTGRAAAAFTLALATTLLFCGCARNYVMKTTSGTRITTASKPKLKNGYYTYKDARGQQQQIGAGRVLEIAPESMATDDKSKFKPASQK
jgi:hypothetical protein